MTLPPHAPEAAPAETKRRPQPGERRAQILQALAAMLEAPGAERITTAALAARLEVSEAALYRHFASKAQMFDALLDFIETSVFTLVRKIVEPPVEPRCAPTGEQGASNAARIVSMVLQFAERNPGMASVMAGDALVLEHPRLRQRMNLFFDKLEAQLRQCLRPALQAAGDAAPTARAQASASVLLCVVRARLQQFVRSDFRRLPTAQLQESLALLL